MMLKILNIYEYNKNYTFSLGLLIILFRIILQVIPDTMFNLLDRILATKSNMVELPTRLEKVMFNFYLIVSMYYLKYVCT